MLDLMLSEVIKRVGPRPEFAHDIGNSARDEDMAGVAAIHDSLRKVDPATGDIEIGIDVGDAIDRTAMKPDAER